MEEVRLIDISMDKNEDKDESKDKAVNLKEKDDFEDDEILAINGDREAFVRIINKNRLSLYKVAKGMLKDDHKVEDAIANTILKAYESVGKLRHSEYFKTWLIRILINECNALLKKETKVIYLENNKADVGKLDEYEDIDLIRAINKLDDDLKEVVILYYFQDMSQKDIGETLKLNDKTVKTKLFRARKKLYEILR